MKKMQEIPGVAPDTFHIGAYCSPQPQAEKDGAVYPSKITYEHYKMLADLGVTVVYGHAEAVGRPGTEPFVYEALRLCERAGIQYLVRDLTAEEYVSLGFREYRDWRKLSKEEKEELDGRFRRSIRKYKNYPAFAGISFFDEPGTDSFEGIAAAKAVFKSECPDKLFYVNLMPNNTGPEQLQYGACQIGVPKSTDGNLAVSRGNGARYVYLLEKYIKTVRPDLISYDSYPFVSLGGAESAVHIALYELLQICAWAEREYGVPFWPFMQVGGMWEGSLDTRVTDYAEMCLYVNAALAYGAKGLQLFPACFPNDWLGDPYAEAGVIDASGRQTAHYHYLKTILPQVQACGELLLHSRLERMISAGRYKSLLPPEEELQKILWNETIFRGKLSGCCSIGAKRWRELTGVKATSQFLIGCFDCGGASLFYAVNNSIVTAADVTLKFDREHSFTLIRKGRKTQAAGSELTFRRVAAGDGILISVNEQLSAVHDNQGGKSQK